MVINFDNVPSELRAYDAWVLWKLETVNGRVTKVPYSPHYRGKASPINPGHWGSFDQVRSIYNAHSDELAGIGFVLSKYDPFGFIDLDDYRKCNEPDFAYQVQKKVLDRIPSFTEFSPSGTGLHIITKADMLPEGTNWHAAGIEVYTDARFMTVTGNTFRELPIYEKTAEVHSLWAKLKEAQGSNFDYAGDIDQTREDSEIIDIAMRASNSAKFDDLYHGRWEAHYPGQSEAYLGLMNMIVFYSRNLEQSKRIFMNSPLRTEVDVADSNKYATRPALLDREAKMAFDRLPPPMDFGVLKMKLQLALEARSEAATEAETAASVPEPGKVLAQPKVELTYDEAVKTFPPGLVGKVAQFIYDQSPSPIREVSLVAAIGFVAGITGRAWNVSGTGLNQYLLMLAVTGAGKEACHSGISKLFTAAKGDGIGNGFNSADTFSGPADLASGRGLLTILADNPSCVSVIGEFGIRLKNMSLANANSAERDLKRVIMDAYAKSGAGNSINPTAYADKTKNQAPILSPAFSFIGESTPERFYEVLDENMVEDGLMPRFTIIEYKGDIPPFNEAAANTQVSPELVDEIRNFMFLAHDRNKRNDICNVTMSEPAFALFRYFMEFRRSMLNNRQNSSASRHMWNRAPLKAMKLAATVAVGINPIEPVIDMDVATWAVAIALGDAHNIIRRFDAGTVGEHILNGGELGQFNDMRAIIGKWLRSGANDELPKDINRQWLGESIIQHSPLLNALRGYASFRKDKGGPTFAFKRTIQHMIEAGVIELVSPAQRREKKTSAVIYAVSDPSYFTSV